MGCTKIGIGVDLTHKRRLPLPVLCNNQLATHNFPGIDIDSLLECLLCAQKISNANEVLSFRELKRAEEKSYYN